MATKTWIGNAAAVKQIDKIAITGTWANGDTVTVTINGKALVVTIGNDTTTAQVAESVRAAFMSDRRLDSEGGTDATSNFGGQECGEFCEIEAVVDKDALSDVLLIGRLAGRPFTVTAADTAAAGAATKSSVQACTGPWHWDNAKNWDSGTVPANDDIVVFRDTSVSCLYGLPSGSLEVTFIVYQSFTGQIGLYEWNTQQGPNKTFKEYRQQYVGLDESGSGTTLTHTFGVGPGTGSPLVNVSHSVAAGLVVSANVFNTGTPQVQGGKALNLMIKNNPADAGTVTILKGSVSLTPWYTSTLPMFSVLNIGQSGQQEGDVDVFVKDLNRSCTIMQSGGRVLWHETTSAVAGDRTLTVYGGTFEMRDGKTSGTISMTVNAGTVLWNADKTITTCILGSRGTFNAENDMRSFTVTNLDLYGGAKWLDGFARATLTNGLDLNRCALADCEIRIGTNRRLTLGTAA